MPPRRLCGLREFETVLLRPAQRVLMRENGALVKPRQLQRNGQSQATVLVAVGRGEVLLDHVEGRLGVTDKDVLGEPCLLVAARPGVNVVEVGVVWVLVSLNDAHEVVRRLSVILRLLCLVNSIIRCGDNV